VFPKYRQLGLKAGLCLGVGFGATMFIILIYNTRHHVVSLKYQLVKVVLSISIIKIGLPPCHAISN
jgi:hypothetical protein